MKKEEKGSGIFLRDAFTASGAVRNLRALPDRFPAEPPGTTEGFSSIKKV
jgi:hypothetical protein